MSRAWRQAGWSTAPGRLVPMIGVCPQCGAADVFARHTAERFQARCFECAEITLHRMVRDKDAIAAWHLTGRVGAAMAVLQEKAADAARKGYRR